MTTEVWSRRRADALAGSATESVRIIVDRFSDYRYSVPVGAHQAWGQYLGGEHHSGTHWGIYGTSAAVQTLALKVRVLQTGGRPTDDRLVGAALGLLPEDKETVDDALRTKAEKGDLDNVLKLAFVIDALRPNDRWVSEGNEPRIVHQILGLAIDEHGWSSRPHNDEDRFERDRFFPTAYLVACLRRYEAFELSPLGTSARGWLADRIVRDDALYGTPLNYALVGLALIPRPESRRTAAAHETDALGHCQQKLVEWASSQRDIVIDRPVFNGFSLGLNTDYVFLHPELLAALFFLRRGSPASSRRFTLKVVAALTTNIREHQGFTSNNGVVSTVDQMWAVRLLHEFLEAKAKPNSQYDLLPPVDLRVTLASGRSRVAAVVAMAIFIVLLSVFLADGSILVGIGAALVVMLGIAIPLLLTPTSSG